MAQNKKMPTPVTGTLRKFALHVPACIRQCSGIVVLGKRIKSLVFSTDLAIVKNVNADAVMAVHPFTPQPAISGGIIQYADIPVFAGVGGGLTQGERVAQIAMFSEMQGAVGVVVNAPTENESIRRLASVLDIPVVVTVVSEFTDVAARIEAGAKILNISAADKTPEVVAQVRRDFPDIPIIATGGPTDETILRTIAAGANAITWTPPSTGEVFRGIMDAYRKGLPHP